MLQRWQTVIAIVAILGAAAVWAADQRWATKAEAQVAQSAHDKLHQEETHTRAQMTEQLTQTMEDMAALREDIAFLRCFLDPRTDWDAFKQTCVERADSSLPAHAGRVSRVPPSTTVPPPPPHSPAPAAPDSTPSP